MRLLFLLLPVLYQLGECQDLTAICGSLEAQASCGQCIKQHPDCAWCRDPHTTHQNRCQVRSAFKAETCNPTYVYSPATEVRIGPHNLPLGSPGSGKSVVQIEPQQVVLRMKPGDTLNVQYKYMHKKPAPGYDVKEFLVQTSEFKKLGLEMKFFVDCNGREVEGKQCPTLKEGQKVNFKIKVTLLECRDGADVAISVGVYGYTTVSALYITPLCGCECEKPTQQASSRFQAECSGNGHCECGKCVCDEGFNGAFCGAPDEVVTASTPEKEEMPEPEEEPSESVEPSISEEDVKDAVCVMVEENPEPANSEENTPTETSDGDYGSEPELPEEATSSSSVLVFLTSIFIATIFI
ncbi:EGF-like domain protein [Necator americanus]|uniref:EGF-like domain protein n=1 Tax=Necator americanus TaxID=51031 RepID=W2SHC7_NECAM|nr:EGF-like domain protein [Necator americanus]ETN69054.1 EGF-like domain protein [Necator americanus]